MDIEGAEQKISGMPNLLAKRESLKVVTEFALRHLALRGVKPVEYLKMLARHKFELFNVNEMEMRIDPVEIAELLESYTPERGNFTTLLCARRRGSPQAGAIRYSSSGWANTLFLKRYLKKAILVQAEVWQLDLPVGPVVKGTSVGRYGWCIEF
jgi:hypothetical protein